MSQELDKSQLARNFIRKLRGESTSRSRLKIMLDTLAAEKDCDVLEIRDQTELTCAIVVQSSVQKLAFEHWGETLAFDRTHGTNTTLERSLVATTLTDRGFPVLDVMSLNEKAVTLRKCFDFFKTTNRPWTKIKSLVIDNIMLSGDFLRNVSRSHRVAVSVSRHHVQKKNFCKPVQAEADQDAIQFLFAKILYSNTYFAYFRAFKAFCSFCDAGHKSVRQYFDKNCKVFSAGNTTTNRIESNWHLIKQLLGMKTAIDQAVRGVLMRQANVASHFLYILHRHNSRC
ncbi:LOW QUALITY PROTEIN: hypothetical protein PHMEG_0009443 [Phytophthora megakarya]|uniref:ZSWIM1/3 RNaseH-like domain-containing protein n=1 Tax=Phytophthora megakarya TaxID=4795 RepID=A0A225WHZ1_9STRA|nr:LOW QUALITY PROTEIN: hypothetical protein PHMEG_0009443 [Phytophthora megakarya]